MAMYDELGEQGMSDGGSGDWFAENQPPASGAPTPAPAQAPPAAQPGTQGAAGKDAFGRAWLASGGRTVDDLKNFVAQNPQYGVTLGGSKGDKVYGSDGSFWADAVIGAGAGGQGGSWQTESGDAGGGGAFTAPYGGKFSLMSPQDYINSPFAQAALGEIRQGGERGAAARGTLLTPGTELAIGRKQLGYLGDSYAQMANMDLGVQQGNYGIFKDNQDRPFDKLYRTSALGLDATNSAANNASTYSTNAQNNATNTGSAQAAGTAAQNNATTGAISGATNAGLSAYNQWLASRGRA